jgi:phage shock protein A
MFQSFKKIGEALFSPAKDPRKTLSYTYQHQNELLVKVKQALQEMESAHRSLVAKVDTVRGRIPDLDAHARTALAAGDEARARFALQRKQIALVELDGLCAQLEDITKERTRLTTLEQRLAMQIEALLARQELISARHSAAEAQVYITQEIGSVSEELAELDTALANAEVRAERLQERASALEQIATVNMLTVPGHVSSERVQENIKRLNLVEAVEESLESLKKEIGGDSGKKRG